MSSRAPPSARTRQPERVRVKRVGPEKDVALLRISGKNTQRIFATHAHFCHRAGLRGGGAAGGGAVVGVGQGDSAGRLTRPGGGLVEGDEGGVDDGVGVEAVEFVGVDDRR